MNESPIFYALKNDHDRHREMFARLAETQGDSQERRSLFEKLRTELQAHAAAEEESLYATMLANPDLRDDARHSVAEHKEIEDRLAELLETNMAEGAWLLKFKELQHRYFHHIDEEEEDMFPAAAKKLSDKTETQLARTFKERKPDELDRAEKEAPGDERE